MASDKQGLSEYDSEDETEVLNYKGGKITMGVDDLVLYAEEEEEEEEELSKGRGFRKPINDDELLIDDEEVGGKTFSNNDEKDSEDDVLEANNENESGEEEEDDNEEDLEGDSGGDDSDDGSEVDLEKEAADIETMKRKGLREMRSLSGSYVAQFRNTKKNERTLGAFLDEVNEKHQDKIMSKLENNIPENASNEGEEGFNPISKYEEEVELLGLTLYELHREKRSISTHISTAVSSVTTLHSKKVEKKEIRSEDCVPAQSHHRVGIVLKALTPELTCPICLGVLRNTMVVMECGHRFCSDCIEKFLRVGNNSGTCPSCRVKIPTRRCLRRDHDFDSLIRKIYPNIKEFEANEEEQFLALQLARQNAPSLKEQLMKAAHNNSSSAIPSLSPSSSTSSFSSSRKLSAINAKVGKKSSEMSSDSISKSDGSIKRVPLSSSSKKKKRILKDNVLSSNNRTVHAEHNGRGSRPDEEEIDQDDEGKKRETENEKGKKILSNETIHADLKESTKNQQKPKKAEEGEKHALCMDDQSSETPRKKQKSTKPQTMRFYLKCFTEEFDYSSLISSLESSSIFQLKQFIFSVLEPRSSQLFKELSSTAVNQRSSACIDRGQQPKDQVLKIGDFITCDDDNGGKSSPEKDCDSDGDSADSIHQKQNGKSSRKNKEEKPMDTCHQVQNLQNTKQVLPSLSNCDDLDVLIMLGEKRVILDSSLTLKDIEQLSNSMESEEILSDQTSSSTSDLTLFYRRTVLICQDVQDNQETGKSGQVDNEGGGGEIGSADTSTSAVGGKEMSSSDASVSAGGGNNITVSAAGGGDGSSGSNVTASTIAGGDGDGACEGKQDNIGEKANNCRGAGGDSSGGGGDHAKNTNDRVFVNGDGGGSSQEGESNSVAQGDHVETIKGGINVGEVEIESDQTPTSSRSSTCDSVKRMRYSILDNGSIKLDGISMHQASNSPTMVHPYGVLVEPVIERASRRYEDQLEGSSSSNNNSTIATNNSSNNNNNNSAQVDSLLTQQQRHFLPRSHHSGQSLTSAQARASLSHHQTPTEAAIPFPTKNPPPSFSMQSQINGGTSSKTASSSQQASSYLPMSTSTNQKPHQMLAPATKPSHPAVHGSGSSFLNATKGTNISQVAQNVTYKPNTMSFQQQQQQQILQQRQFQQLQQNLPYSYPYPTTAFTPSQNTTYSMTQQLYKSSNGLKSAFDFPSAIPQHQYTNQRAKATQSASPMPAPTPPSLLTNLDQHRMGVYHHSLPPSSSSSVMNPSHFRNLPPPQLLGNGNAFVTATSVPTSNVNSIRENANTKFTQHQTQQFQLQSPPTSSRSDVNCSQMPTYNPLYYPMQQRQTQVTQHFQQNQFQRQQSRQYVPLLGNNPTYEQSSLHQQQHQHQLKQQQQRAQVQHQLASSVTSHSSDDQGELIAANHADEDKSFNNK